MKSLMPAIFVCVNSPYFSRRLPAWPHLLAHDFLDLHVGLLARLRGDHCVRGLLRESEERPLAFVSSDLQSVDQEVDQRQAVRVEQRRVAFFVGHDVLVVLEAAVVHRGDHERQLLGLARQLLRVHPDLVELLAHLFEGHFLEGASHFELHLSPGLQFEGFIHDLSTVVQSELSLDGEHAADQSVLRDRLAALLACGLLDRLELLVLSEVEDDRVVVDENEGVVWHLLSDLGLRGVVDERVGAAVPGSLRVIGQLVFFEQLGLFSVSDLYRAGDERDDEGDLRVDEPVRLGVYEARLFHAVDTLEDDLQPDVPLDEQLAQAGMVRLVEVDRHHELELFSEVLVEDEDRDHAEGGLSEDVADPLRRGVSHLSPQLDFSLLQLDPPPPLDLSDAVQVDLLLFAGRQAF